MSIEVNVSGNPIQASVTESGASVSVSPLSIAASVSAVAVAAAAAAQQPTLSITGGSTSPLILELIQQVTT